MRDSGHIPSNDNQNKRKKSKKEVDTDGIFKRTRQQNDLKNTSMQEILEPFQLKYRRHITSITKDVQDKQSKDAKETLYQEGIVTNRKDIMAIVQSEASRILSKELTSKGKEKEIYTNAQASEAKRDTSQTNEEVDLERQEITARVRFGSTKLEVTRICAGAAKIGDLEGVYRSSVSEEDAVNTIKSVFRSEFNFMDTSANYGKSEERIGKAIQELGGLPEGFVLATKADRDDKNDFSGEQVRRSIEQSLKNLGLDTLPLVWLHDPEFSNYNTCEKIMAPDGPAQALLKLKEEGKIKYIGIASGPIPLMEQLVETGKFDAVLTHNRHNLLWRTADSLLNSAKEKGMAVVNAAPFAGGIFAKGSEKYPYLAYQDLSPEIRQKVKAMEDICENNGVSLRAAALQFSLRDSRITTTIVGITKPEQLGQLFDDASTEIPQEVWDKIDELAIRQGDPFAEDYKQT